ncbi:oligosaccharide flippase family protein [Shewanella oncorhynchi]|uniref:oligosaccharide flippase family protein n=1 Tax=Shewanella oncorhynchi TaxID=2726434 RepID=UPI0039EFA948
MRNRIFNSLWIALDKLFILGGGLLVYILVSNYLGPEFFGVVTFGVAISSIPIVISQWGGNHTIFNSAIKNGFISYNYIVTSELHRVALYLFISILIIFYLYFFSDYGEYAFLISMIVLAHVFSGLDLMQYFFDGSIKSKFNAKASMFSKLVSMTNRALFVGLKVDAFFFFIPYLINNFISYYYKRLAFNRETDFVINKAYKIEFFRVGSPFLISAIFALIYMKVNEVMLATLTNFSNLALYNVALTIGFAWSFIPHAIGLSFIGRGIEQGDEKDQIDSFSCVCFAMIVVSLPFLICLSFFSEFLVSLLFNSSFSPSASLLPLMSLTALLSTLGVINNRIISSYDGGGQYLYKKVFVCSFLSIFISYQLINKFGMHGALYSIFLSEVFSLTIGNYFFRHGLVLKIHIGLMRFSNLKKCYISLFSRT